MARALNRAAARKSGTARSTSKTKSTKTNTPNLKVVRGSKTTSGKKSPPAAQKKATAAQKKPVASASKGKSGRKTAAATAKAAQPAPSSNTAANKAGNESLKRRFEALAQATGQIKGMKRAIHKNFFDVGVILNRIRDERLYEVKGYGSFEAFVDREVDISKQVCLASTRIAQALVREQALQAGLERACAAVAALDGDVGSSPRMLRPASGMGMHPIPLHKQ